MLSVGLVASSTLERLPNSADLDRRLAGLGRDHLLTALPRLLQALSRLSGWSAGELLDEATSPTGERLDVWTAELQRRSSEERERATSCCEYLARLVEQGARDRLHQAARMIRAGDDKRDYLRRVEESP